MSRRRADLDAKVVQEYVVVQDYLAVGEKPSITKKQFLNRQNLVQVRAELVDMYYVDFYSRNRNTLLVPDQKGQTYDPFVTLFMRDLISSDENRLASRCAIPSVMLLPGMRQYTIWDAIRKDSAAMIRTVCKRVGLINARYFRAQAVYAGAEGHARTACSGMPRMLACGLWVATTSFAMDRRLRNLTIQPGPSGMRSTTETSRSSPAPSWFTAPMSASSAVAM